MQVCTASSEVAEASSHTLPEQQPALKFSTQSCGATWAQLGYALQSAEAMSAHCSPTVCVEASAPPSDAVGLRVQPVVALAPARATAAAPVTTSAIPSRIMPGFATRAGSAGARATLRGADRKSVV